LTLKKRIIILFLLSSLIPFAGIATVSYFTIYSIVSDKIQNGLQSSLKQVELSLENAIDNLNHTSQQLSYEGSVGRKLGELLSSTEPFERSQLTGDLKREFSVINFTNPSVGLTMYYFQDTQSYDFENFSVKPDFSLDKLPLLASYYKISYYGPHISNNRFDNHYVLSALREVDLPNRENVYVYIETSFNLTQNIMNNDQYGGKNAHIFTDNDGRIAYTEVPDVFVKDTAFQGTTNKQVDGYYWFKETSNQGWSIISVIPTADYNRELNRWFVQIILFSLLFFSITLFLAWLLWKMVYGPLTRFNSEIKLMTQNRSVSLPVKTKIPEFDYLLGQFRQMKEQIWELFATVEQKEKRRIDLELEKLQHQINPHFLMNSLDTVHWLAVMNGQAEIDRFVLSLNKLLYYNLGKHKESATIAEEIGALKEYLTLQQIRYDFVFDVRILVDERVMSMPIPRFILQPIVENSLYHGLNDDGYIEITVELNEGVEIRVRDNGVGMTEDAIDQVLNRKSNDSDKVGMGIGMNYVKRMLHSRYGDRAKLEIRSVSGQGTTVMLVLPLISEGS
jgi:two-component system sensor histidine kinase YesM